MSRPHSSRFTARFIFPLLILTLAVLITFGGTLRNNFVNWDDQNEITENLHFNPVTWNGLLWNWSNTQLSLYMPITYMVWGTVAAIAPRDGLGHLQPMAFHLLNLSLHLICVLLVFFLIFQLVKLTIPATVGALVFAVHPLQVEAVAWASGMYTLLSTAFSLAAILFYLSSLGSWTLDVGSWTFNSESGPEEKRPTSNVQRPTSNGKPKPTFFWLATLFYILALLTKAASVSIVPATMVIDVLILRRPIRKSIRSLLLWILLAVPIVYVAKSFQDVSVIATPPIWGRPIIALDAIGFYLRKIILPIKLIPDYGRNPTWVMQHPGLMLLSDATAILAIILAYAVRRKAVWITAGLGLLLAGAGPYLGLTAFDFQYVSTVADRYAYFGMVGVAIITAGAAARSRAAVVVLLIAVAVWIPFCVIQTTHWHDTDRLFSYTLGVNPNSLVSHGVFGFLAAKRGDFKSAQLEYLAALTVWPQDAQIHFNLGNLYVRQGSTNPVQRQKLLSDAIEQYSLAVKYQPTFVDYRNSLAAALDQIGLPEQAFDQWREAIRLAPGDLDARNNLADMLAKNGFPDRAKEEYRGVLRINPDNQHATEALRKIDMKK